MEVNVAIISGLEKSLNCYDINFQQDNSSPNYIEGGRIIIISDKPKKFNHNTANIIKSKSYIYNLFGLQPNEDISINLWIIPQQLLIGKIYGYDITRNLLPVIGNVVLFPLEFDLAIVYYYGYTAIRLDSNNILVVQTTIDNKRAKIGYSYNGIEIKKEDKNWKGDNSDRYTELVGVLASRLPNIISEKLANRPVDIMAKLQELSDKVNKLSNTVVPAPDENYSLIKGLITKNENLIAEIAKRDTIIQELKNKIVSIKDFTEKICD